MEKLCMLLFESVIVKQLRLAGTRPRFSGPSGIYAFRIRFAGSEPPGRKGGMKDPIGRGAWYQIGN